MLHILIRENNYVVKLAYLLERQLGEDGPEVGRGERLYELFTPAPASYLESHMNKNVGGKKKRSKLLGVPVTFSLLFPGWVDKSVCTQAM